MDFAFSSFLEFSSSSSTNLYAAVYPSSILFDEAGFVYCQAIMFLVSFFVNITPIYSLNRERSFSNRERLWITCPFHF